MTTIPTIAIAADHRGFDLKQHILATLPQAIDCGTYNNADRVDAMDYAIKAIQLIKGGEATRAILICGSGYMMSIAANRLPFIRAAVCATAAQAEAARAHNDINVLCIAADFVDSNTVPDIVKAFIETEPATDPRYAVRRDKLAAFDFSNL